MPNRNRLNGIPGNLAQSYLSTEGYYDGGYQADWLLYISTKVEVQDIEFDILNGSISPSSASIKPILTSLSHLKYFFIKELTNNGFEESFIAQVVLKFKIEEGANNKGIVKCNPYLKDIDGRIYKPKKEIIEFAEPVRNPSMNY